MVDYTRSQVDKGAEGIVPSDIGNTLGLKPSTVHSDGNGAQS